MILKSEKVVIQFLMFFSKYKKIGEAAILKEIQLFLFIEIMLKTQFGQLTWFALERSNPEGSLKKLITPKKNTQALELGKGEPIRKALHTLHYSTYISYSSNPVGSPKNLVEAL